MKPFNQKFSYQYRIVTIITLITIILVTGCSALGTREPLPPTPTITETAIPTPTIDWFPATATPTFIPSRTPTLAINIEAQQLDLKELLINDDFSNTALWQTSQSGSGNVAFGSQSLTLAVAGQGNALISLSQYLLPANFYLEITLQSSLCQPQDQAGINFWYQSSSDFYRLLINCAGQYRLELIQDGRNFVIHDWETAIEIQPGAPASNRVGIWAYQGQLELFFNDTFQREERVSTEQSGGLALFARSIESSAMTVKFSDLKIFSVEKD